MTLTEFLLARIAEDEAVARSAKEGAATPWRAAYGRQVEAGDGHLVTPEDEHSYSTDPPEGVALHIARHDPARMLAECEAKQQLVELAQGLVYLRGIGDPVAPSTPVGEDILEILANVYADHPDYREEWRV